MHINIYTIDKKGKRGIYDPLMEHYINSCKKWASITIHEIFSKEIAKANEISPEAAQASYSTAYDKYLSSGYNIVLDPVSREVDSLQFSNLLKDKRVVNIFIGGAYGFGRGFVDKSDKAISFGKITLSHKLIKVVLAEQIFRGLSILHNHPYHK